MITVGCTHPGYEKALDNGHWKHLNNHEREGWYLRVNNDIYGSDVVEIKCCIKYNRENETCNFQKRNEQNFSFFASFFLLLFRPFKHQLNAD